MMSDNKYKFEKGIKFKKIYVKNGDELQAFYIYKCNSCDCDVPEDFPRYQDEDYCFCMDCAFILGTVTENEYKKFHGVDPNSFRATVVNGEIITWYGKKPPWEKTDKDYRHTTEYKIWRKSVFERDNFTCAICVQVGGKLEAHHIKTFNKFPKLRYELSNGKTLCKSCHKNIHKKVKISAQSE